MTNPPPPGNWEPPQLGAQPPLGQGHPPSRTGQWQPHQGWGPPAPTRNNGPKFLLIAVAVLLVIAISVGATLLFTRHSGDTPTVANALTGDFASANDTGPVSILTEDPTCEPSRPITDALAQKQRKGWDRRDPLIPASEWTPEEQAMYSEIADAMLSTAEQAEILARQTPHRVMRELYEQSIFFWRSYAQSIPTYTADDNKYAMAARTASGTIVSICSAIDTRSALSRSPLVSQSPSSPTTPLSSPDENFVGPSGNPQCSAWKSASDAFDTAIEPWRGVDPNLSGVNWNDEQRRIVSDASDEIFRFADEIEKIGAQSNNGTFADFAQLSAQYWRAYVAAIPSYTATDSYLSATAAFSTYLIVNACAAAKV